MVSIVNLPAEVMVKIFEYLPLSDRLEFSLVNKMWYSICHTKSLHKNTLVYFSHHDQFARGIIPLYHNHTLAFTQIELRDVCFTNHIFEPLMKGFFPRVTFLVLNSCKISEKELVNLLKSCTSLKTLKLIELKDAMISGNLMSDPSDQLELSNALVNVTELDLTYNTYLSDALFNRITGVLVNLESLSLDTNKIMNHSGIYKKFYPPSQQEASPSVLTLRNLISFLRSRATKMKCLDISKTAIDTEAVDEIARIPELKLRKLNLARCVNVTKKSVLEIVKDNHLVDLNLDDCRKVFMDHPEENLMIFESLKNVKHLSLATLTIPSNFDECFEKLKKLETLNGSTLDVNGRLFRETFNRATPNLTLRKLDLSRFQIKPEILREILELPWPKLSHLNLSCSVGVDDHVVNVICRNLNGLKVLLLNSCSQITDRGFFGGASKPRLFEEMQEKLNIRPENRRIFLGSREEYDIVNEAERISKARQIAKELENNPDLDFFNIRSLEKLELNHSRISDLTLSLRLKFFSLRYIDLTRCLNVTDEGLESLGRNNPHLQHIVLRQLRISDAGITAMVKYTPRLAFLELDGCQGIKSDFLDSLVKYCRELKVLDISMVYEISADKADALYSQMPRLREVIRDGCRGNPYHDSFDYQFKSQDIPAAPLPPPYI